MRISELSTASGVPVATIKYYIREGMLPTGDKTSATQADYREEHVTRLRLIRAFIDVAGLSVTSARAVLAAIDDEDLHFGHAAAIAACALPATRASTMTTDAMDARAHGLIDEAAAKLGWTVSPENAGRDVAARVLADYAALGREDLVDTLDVYADAAHRVAQADLEAVAKSPDRAAMTETVVIGTVLGDALFAGLRRMAHEDATVAMFPVPEPHQPLSDRQEPAP